ncbi:MAG: hypothetical protein QOD66_2202 [Solirubrobacteraceae bacterium]|nr:hypothetical protein [Solirubrobacteraceae bacterium]
MTALAVVICLALAGVALAAFSKVTGGSTQITASPAAAKVLADNHITVTPVAPATASGTTFTFPIAGGRLNPQTLHGVIRHRGGLSLSNGTRTVTLRRPTIVSTKRGAWMYAMVRFHSERIARLTNVSVAATSATATMKLTAASARLINALAGKHVTAAGAPFATGTITPTLK